MSISLRGAAHRAHQAPRLVQRALAGGEPRHGVGEDVRARQPHHVHRARADDQRLRRIEPARDADHHLVGAHRAQALHQALHLDLVDLVAALVARGRIGRHVGEALVAALAAAAARPRGSGSGKRTLRKCDTASAWRAADCAEAVGAHAVLRDAVEIDVAGDQVRLVGEALGLGDARAVLVDHAVAVPGEVGGRLAVAGGAVQIRGEAARRTGWTRAGGGTRPCRP